MTRAVVLFAHGARDPAWAAPLRAIADTLAAKLPGTPVSVAYLELMEPSLAAAVGVQVAEGVNTIDVYPLFFAAGAHLKRDLPELAKALMAEHVGLCIQLHPPVGEIVQVQQAIACAIANIVQAPQPPPSH